MSDMKKNEQLEQIRKRVSQSVKNEVDEMIAWIDCAYELGCRDTKQKLNIHGVMQAGSDGAEGAAVGNGAAGTVAEGWVCCGCGLIDGTFYCDRGYCINDTRGGSDKGALH